MQILNLINRVEFRLPFYCIFGISCISIVVDNEGNKFYLHAFILRELTQFLPFVGSLPCKTIVFDLPVDTMALEKLLISNISCSFIHCYSLPT